MDKCLGFGGVGDCFIVILKLLEHTNPLTYTHIDTNRARLELCADLLDHFDIDYKCLIVGNIQQWWYTNHDSFDMCFNVFANGFINIMRRPYHWEPCTDYGYNNPFADDIQDKVNKVAVQVNSGGERSYKYKPIIEHVMDSYRSSQILWFGTDEEFESEYGTNYCGKLDFIDALERIAQCKYFVGFPSVLLYWSLWHKSKCYLFTDHQDKNDLRIHKEWKRLITYDI